MADTAICDTAAWTLAQQLQIPYLQEQSAIKQYDYIFILTKHCLGLYLVKAKKPLFYINFLSKNMLYRYQQATLQREALAQALGCLKHRTATIVDATAGLGYDSLLLATLGFSVMMLERSLSLVVLLRDALARAREHPYFSPIISNMTLIHTDANAWLSTLTTAQKPDVIYLDPMFPPRKKSALVNKNMQFLQYFIGHDDNSDSDMLLHCALTCAKKRVVIKRPRLIRNLTYPPTYSIQGRSSRFDVYIIHE